MGQPNSRESRLSKRDKSEGSGGARRSSVGATAATAQSAGIRADRIRENVLQLPSHYRDPMGDAVTAQVRSAERKQDASTSSPAPQTIMTTATIPAVTAKKYPVVLRYADKNTKALLDKKKKVFVAVEALQWQPLPMTPSEDSFYAILELPRGTHRYHFIVDGKNIVDKSQPTADLLQQEQVQEPDNRPTDNMESNDNNSGNSATNNNNGEVTVNMLELNDALLFTREDEEIMDDGEGWGQEQIIFEESRKHPPLVPVHLRYTPLNTPPNAVRCTRDGVVSAAGDVMPPENLPLPLNVTINHVYFQRREDHSVMGLTTRYCNKYTTVVYYATMGTPSG